MPKWLVVLITAVLTGLIGLFCGVVLTKITQSEFINVEDELKAALTNVSVLSDEIAETKKEISGLKKEKYSLKNQIKKINNKARNSPPVEFTPKITEQEPVIKTYNFRDRVYVGHMYYRINSACWARYVQGEYSNTYPDAQFLVISMNIENKDSKARNIPRFKLVDGDGAEYDSSAEGCLAVEDGISVLDDLNPGVYRSGTIVFDAPSFTTYLFSTIRKKYRLKVSGGFWTNEYALIDIPADISAKSYVN